MGTRSRLALLVLTGILGSTPIGRLPGWNGTPAKPATCPDDGAESIEKSGNQYWCRICESWFTPRETAEPGES